MKKVQKSNNATQMIDNDTIYVHKEIQNMLHAEEICAEASLSRRK